MRANKNYSKAFIDCWFMHTYCSHNMLCKNLKICVCISLGQCFIMQLHYCYCPTQDSVEIDNISGSAKS